MEGQLLFVPNVVRLTTQEERGALIQKVADRFKNGTWCGAHINGRPALCMRTAQGDAETRAGMRKRQGNGAMPGITFYASHVVLLASGQYPGEDDEASHLCHNPGCLLPWHLVWERGDFNRRRKYCARMGRCVCKLLPPCLLHAHDKDN